MTHAAACDPYASDTGLLECAQYEGFDPYEYAAEAETGYYDTGWSLKKLSRKAKRVARAAVKQAPLMALGVPVPLKAKTFRRIKRTARKVGRTVSKRALPIVKRAMPLAQTALRNMGPMGMAASGALGAMSAVLQGQNLEQIAWAAAMGAAPTGIDTAIRAAKALREGRSPISVALNAASSTFIPGSSGAQGFSLAKDVLVRGASKAALGAARRRLTDEAARRAFDAAVGTVAKAAQRETRGYDVGAFKLRKISRLAKRGSNLLRKADPLAVTSVAVRKVTRKNLPLGHGATALVSRAIAVDPTLAVQGTRAIARKLGMPQSTVVRALERSARALPYRPLNRETGALVRRFTQLRDTAGLIDNGTVYEVEAGDGLWKIAQKLVGDGNRYRELMSANPQYPRSATGDNFLNVWVGMKLKLPASWVKQTAPAETAESILQAKALLVTWSKTDGADESGVTDYGMRPTDATVDWTERDRLMLASFSSWANSERGAELATGGTLSAEHIEALRGWAEARAAVPTPAPAASTPAPEPAPAPGVAPWLESLPTIFAPPAATAPTPEPAPAPSVLPWLADLPTTLPIPQPQPAPPPAQVLPFPVESPPTLPIPISAPRAESSDSSSGGALLFALAAAAAAIAFA